MSLRTASFMSAHSFDVCREHPRLLVLAGLGLAASLALAALFMAAALQLTPADVWQWLQMWDPLPAREALREFGEVGHWDWPWAQLAAFHVCSTVLGNCIDLALCSQSIQALNGGRVSLTRGFSLVLNRLPALVAWSLVDSTLSLLASVIGERFGFIRQRIVRSFGVSWSAARVFVIPVMLNESRSRSPFEYLRISGGIASRTWGEGVLDMFSPPTTRVGPIVLYWVIFMAAWMAFLSHLYAPLLLAGLVVIVLGVGAHRLFEIYRSGLYIFATEGVLPGPFNDDLFRHAWVVRGNA